MKTFNKRGDSGETSLLYGGRVAKSDLRCEAYGTLDEAISMLGAVRCLCSERTKGMVLDVQRELFVVGAELATPPEYHQALKEKHGVVTAGMVERLEKLIEEMEGEMEMPNCFVVPGGCLGSALLDVARAMVRRGERRVVSLLQQEQLPNKEVLSYLNRLADLLYVLARYEERLACPEGPTSALP